ncbi:MAG: hypothetical protein ISR95_06650 [Candidatus Marinimicrobia bacterium]|nr:hypothetical protein [Candidatus Neomarinimicrobiota bacterium]
MEVKAGLILGACTLSVLFFSVHAPLWISIIAGIFIWLFCSFAGEHKQHNSRNFVLSLSLGTVLAFSLRMWVGVIAADILFGVLVCIAPPKSNPYASSLLPEVGKES